jgi:hypothetical protein
MLERVTKASSTIHRTFVPLLVLERRFAIAGGEASDEALPSLRRTIWFGPPSPYTHQFCTARCLEIWKRVQSDKARQYRFLEWLNPGAASLPARPASIPARNDTRGVLNRVHRRG